MKQTKRFFNRVLSVFSVLAILATMIPVIVSSAVVTSADTRVADRSTLNDWQKYFHTPGATVLDTKNAGGVWSDKSVFTSVPTELSNVGITMGDDGFLVALSALATNSVITGYTEKPTDTVFVLDVSGSMNESNNGMADEMVDSANTAIADLLKANPNNRVGVVLYSGSSQSQNSNAAVTVLPLNRYTTASDGVYLSYANDNGETISLDSDVYIAGTTRRPTSTGKQVVGATYIQKGLYQAMNILTAATTSFENEAHETVGRIPVVVLMSDGAPTLADTDFTAPGSHDMGSGNSSSTGASEGFATQLTAAYVKAKVTEHYNTDCRFYTLGLGIDVIEETTAKNIALSVLDPSKSTTAINTFWTQYQALSTNQTLTIEDNFGSYNDRKVTKISTALTQNYVDRYFEAYDNGNGMGDSLKDAFAGIVGIIKLQSQFYPTFVESGNAHLDGFINIVDTLAPYMEVEHIQGIVLGDHLFSGNMLSQNFVAGGGALGTFENPTALGDAMVDAVRTRLGLESDDAARTLIELAYQNGQLSYTDDQNFSNYIGWYANANNEFLDFWHEGITTMPDPSTITDPAKKPVFINRSYGFFGAVDAAHGVTESDMLYVTVQVHTRIDTGETTILFGVPAALLPLITYNISQNENGDVTEITTTGATSPIRLVYEVALRDDINAFNVAEKVSATHKKADGSYGFYLSTWDDSHLESFENSYMYFEPSLENGQYYFTEDTTVYTDTFGTVFTGTTLSETGTYYVLDTWWERDENLYVKRTEYEPLEQKTLAEALENGPTNVIPKGTAHHFYEQEHVLKDPAVTDTSNWSWYHFTIHNEETHRHYGAATLGNNGYLTLTPETGLRLSKTVTETVSGAGDTFTFTLTRTDKTDDTGTYAALHVAADGTQTATTVTFEDGKAQATLKDGEVLYIGGMENAATYTVSENGNRYYVVDSVNNTAEKTASVTVQTGVMAAVNFVNAPRTYGDLTIAKTVQHPFGIAYEIPSSLTFTMDVTLEGDFVDGTYNATHASSGGTLTPTTVTVTDGNFVVELKHGEQITVQGLPQGTVATVTERTPSAGFIAPRYEDNGAVANDGQVTIGNVVASVLVVNTYEPAPVTSPKIKVEGSKTVEGENAPDETFSFVLQRYNGTTWEPIATKTAKHGGTFNFNTEMAAERYPAAGEYYYRVMEVDGGTVQNGMTYDSTVHVFQVVVGDRSMSGALEITYISDPHSTGIVSGNAANGYTITTNFTNRYGASGDVVAVPVKKTMYNPSGSPYLSPEGFRFVAYDAQGQEAVVSEMSDGAGYTQLVFNFPYDNTRTSNTFTYTVRERGAGMVVDKMYFAREEYELVFAVTYHNDGTTTAVLTSVNEQTPPAELAFENKYLPEAATLDLNLSKVLTGRAMEADEFTFQVYDGTTLIAEGTNAAAEDGKAAAITLQTPITFDKVGDYHYTVKEVKESLGGITYDETVYQLHIRVTDNARGQLSAEYHVANTANNAVVFRNTYTPTPDDITLTAEKKLIGRVLLGGEFAFHLTQVDETGTVIPDGETQIAYNDVNGNITFEKITYTKAGLYYYAITEDKGGTEEHGIRYDDSTYRVTVKVDDDGIGTLTASVNGIVRVDTTGTHTVAAVVMENVYEASPVKFAFGGSKQLEGRLLTAGDVFTFELYEANEQWAAGQWLQTTQNAGETFSFEAIEYATVGTYRYLVKEQGAGQTVDGVTNSLATYGVEVTVTDTKIGQLQAAVTAVYTIGDEVVPVERVTFVNTYAVVGEGTATIGGVKVLENQTLTDDWFTFELYETDETFAIGETATALKTAKNADGEFLFETLTYTEAGDYYYAIREQNHGATIDGITYSNAVYGVKVTVADVDGKGYFTTTVTYYSGTIAVEADDVVFKNVYAIADDAKATLGGTKTLTGKPLTENAFAFDLYVTDATFAITDEAVQTVKNGADGTFTFETLTYAEAGDYYYAIREVNHGKRIGSITYSDAVYGVKVTVADVDGKGYYTTTVTYYNGTTAVEAADVVFTNVYTRPNDLTVPLNVKKTVKNLGDIQIGPEGFEFVLTDEANGKRYVKSDENGDAGFTLTFTDEDVGKTFTYTITETNEGKANIRYSTAVYTVTVTITLTDDNTLEAALTQNGVATESVTAAFENIHTGTTEEPPAPPQTGETTHWLSWILVLFVGGGVAGATSRKRKSAK